MVNFTIIVASPASLAQNNLLKTLHSVDLCTFTIKVCLEG